MKRLLLIPTLALSFAVLGTACDKAEDMKADLIVVGSHGRHGLTLLLGSTANGVVGSSGSSARARSRRGT